MGLLGDIKINEQDFSEKFNTPGIKKVTFNKVTLEEDYTDDYGNSFEGYFTLLFNEFNELGLDSFVPKFAKIEFKLKSSNDEKEIKSFFVNMSQVLACFFDGKQTEALAFLKKNEESLKKLEQAINSLFAKHSVYWLKVKRGLIGGTPRYWVNIRANHPCLVIDESKIFYSDERDSDPMPEINNAGYVNANAPDIKSDPLPF